MNVEFGLLRRKVSSDEQVTKSIHLTGFLKLGHPQGAACSRKQIQSPNPANTPIKQNLAAKIHISFVIIDNTQSSNHPGHGHLNLMLVCDASLISHYYMDPNMVRYLHAEE